MSAEERKAENAQAVEVLSREVQSLDENSFPTLKSIGENELFRLRGGISDTLDVVDNKRVKIRAKVTIPVEQYPSINFVGKLLGPGGQTLRSIQEETRTKMAILGHGSLRDEAKEKELLSGGDPKYQHLKQPLHLQIDCLAPPAEAYYNVSHALAQVKRVMMPDANGQQNAPWGVGAPNAAGRGAAAMRGRGRGRGGFANQAAYGTPANFATPPAGAMRGARGGATRGRGWGVSSAAPAAGPTAAAVPAQGDVYGNGMEQYAYPEQLTYDQSQYTATGYEDYSAQYGQTDAWGKMLTTDSRGRARAHPYARPGGKEETA
ncbi:KH domain containing RNA binding signal [Echinococcus multilocularis]|uniref:KH domain containing RNA binding signal n=1 Tax=Echinococcus multilocularis TaxID=6211 RepID=A0A068XZB5_ECHMU|nr:KH domain containing RNA binding signal [Echinococcus multilocularis]